jgi:hypothetical protein
MQVSEGVSLEAQQSKANAWCLANNYHVAEIYVDAGVSGKRTDNRIVVPIVQTKNSLI